MLLSLKAVEVSNNLDLKTKPTLFTLLLHPKSVENCSTYESTTKHVYIVKTEAQSFI